MEFAGRIASFSPANLLQWAESERKTGTLVVRRTRREKRIAFRSGRIVGCRSNRIHETFGRFLVDHGLIRPDALARVLAHTRSTGTPTGQALAELGILPSEIVVEQLGVWIAESVQDFCLWRRGVFVFHENEPVVLPLEVAVGTQGVALEGAHWVDEMMRLRRALPDDGVVLRRGPSWPGAGESPFAERIARSVAPAESTLGSLRQVVGGTDFTFLAAVRELIDRGVLEVVRHDAVLEFDSREVALEDVLGVLESEGAFVPDQAHPPLIPSDILERLVPVWLRPPTAEELSRLAPSLRAFVEGIDGRSRLGELVSRDAEQLEDETDLLLLHLERGSLALFPAPLEGSGSGAGDDLPAHLAVEPAMEEEL
jgi:hypothetical protein